MNGETLQYVLQGVVVLVVVVVCVCVCVCVCVSVKLIGDVAYAARDKHSLLTGIHDGNNRARETGVGRN